MRRPRPKGPKRHLLRTPGLEFPAMQSRIAAKAPAGSGTLRKHLPGLPYPKSTSYIIDVEVKYVDYAASSGVPIFKHTSGYLWHFSTIAANLINTQTNFLDGNIRRREIPTDGQHQPPCSFCRTQTYQPEMLLESLLATEGVAHDRFDVEPHR